ncbi:glutamate racemase, partial [Candidatus Kaiserbacteria bacterium]|nr:glutamate racemase [Candidatus Kaiserbacteria bacterium]
FFDSGLGGLTILKAVAKALPEYDYVYYGDTANIPYGDKTEEEIYALTVRGVEYLFKVDCSLVVIACNTASAETARRIQEEFLPTNFPDRKVLGVIVPTIEELNFGKMTKVALLATKRTIESKKYHKELELKGNGNALLIDMATPELVPLIELGELEAATNQAISRIETEAGESEVVVLGCTHYTEIKRGLRAHFKETKNIISQDEVIPEKLKTYLAAHPEIETKLSRGGERVVHLTEHKPYFDQILQQLLGGVMVEEN